EQKQEDLTVVQREVREEENDANAQKNVEPVLEVTQVQSHFEQALQKETQSARNESHENELLRKRIASLEQEFLQRKSVRYQYEILKTIHQNTLRQMEALREKLEAADTGSARREDYENELLQKRISSLEQELSQHEPVREQYGTLKTLYQRQIVALKKKVEAATSRADSVRSSKCLMDDS
ncbi:hypothetical protein AAVH_37397, partial [Aphelenchoides avenae]